jgi:hypothetical protein
MSGNPKELRKARKAANEAAADLEAIEALPRRKGSRVRWRNGVIWERMGDDAWRPATAPDDDSHWTYTSLHVASFGFWEVKD